MKLVKLGGFAYRLFFGSSDEVAAHNADKDYGGCHDPFAYPEPTIVVDRDLRGLERLETLVHEMLHGACTYHTEEWVTENAREMARVIMEDGWVREEERTKLAPPRVIREG